MNKTNIAIFVNMKVRSHSKRKKPKLFASHSESRVNPVAQSLRENYHPVDEISPVSNDVFVVIYVCEVDLSGVLILISRTVLKTFITIKFVQFKIEEY